jgi:hypothetical protein
MNARWGNVSKPFFQNGVLEPLEAVDWLAEHRQVTITVVEETAVAAPLQDGSAACPTTTPNAWVA